MFAPANNILQAEYTDLSTGMTLVAACVKDVQYLRTEEKFYDIWDEVFIQIDAHSRRTRRDNTLLQDYVVEETTGNNEMIKTKYGDYFIAHWIKSSIKQTCVLVIKIQKYMLLSLLFNLKLATF